jgi:selenocysteine-specific elongation factor
VPAAVSLLDRGELRPGETAFAQLRLGQAVAALPGQRFILRGFTVLEGRGKTVGGGRILSVAAPRRRRGRPETSAQLEVLARGDPDARVGAVLEMAGPAGLALEGLMGRTALAPKIVQGSLDRLGARGGAVLFDREHRAYVAGPVAAELSRRLLAAAEAFHAERPLAAGIGREALRGRLPPVTDARLYQRLLAHLAERGELVVEGEHVRRKGHAAASGAAEGALKERVARAIEGAGLTPPWVAELPGLAGVRAEEVAAVLKLLVAEGRVVRTTPELYFSAPAVAGLRERLVAHLRTRKEITTQEFKDLVGATRKHVIPLAEYFDREKVTLRIGERRVLRGEGK